MPKDIDGLDFVTDDNTGGFFVCECQHCGEVFNSKDCFGGRQIADTGDDGDIYCPHCEQVDPEECDNPNKVWNVQQAKINTITDAYAFLAEEYGKVLALAGFSENKEAGKRDAMNWIDPKKRPATE